jgi:hypothetical protein
MSKFDALPFKLFEYLCKFLDITSLNKLKITCKKYNKINRNFYFNKYHDMQLISVDNYVNVNYLLGTNYDSIDDTFYSIIFHILKNNKKCIFNKYDIIENPFAIIKISQNNKLLETNIIYQDIGISNNIIKKHIDRFKMHIVRNGLIQI